MVEAPPRAVLPPKPKPPLLPNTLPTAAPPYGATAAPPYGATATPAYGVGEDDIYDEGEEMEDVYDIPSEIEQQELSRVGKPPAPPPTPLSPPAARTPSPIDEDIYDTADLDAESQSFPPLPVRPPKVYVRTL